MIGDDGDDGIEEYIWIQHCRSDSGGSWVVASAPRMGTDEGWSEEYSVENETGVLILWLREGLWWIVGSTAARVCARKGSLPPALTNLPFPCSPDGDDENWGSTPEPKVYISKMGDLVCCSIGIVGQMPGLMPEWSNVNACWDRNVCRMQIGGGKQMPLQVETVVVGQSLLFSRAVAFGSGSPLVRIRCVLNPFSGSLRVSLRLSLRLSSGFSRIRMRRRRLRNFKPTCQDSDSCSVPLFAAICIALDVCS